MWHRVSYCKRHAFLLCVFIYHASLVRYTDLSEIRYHFTPCQSVGKTGPDYDSCRYFYAQRNSLIADDILLPGDKSKAYQEHAQVFRVTRDTVYNVTLAGATGGRGLCNIEEGRGLVLHLRVTLSTKLHYLLLVGQKGLGPCDVDQPEIPLCQNRPNSSEESSNCSRAWLQSLEQEGIAQFAYDNTGGGGGGGASLIRALNASSGVYSDVLPYAIAGGGGGSSAILDYSVIRQLIPAWGNRSQSDEVLYREFLDGKVDFYDPTIDNTNNGYRGYRVDSQGLRISGAGGGCLAAPSGDYESGEEDGHILCGMDEVGEGGDHCASNSIQSIPLREADGGFGGGGGGCGGGGGGGGYTGGAVLGDANTTPGGGGYLYYGQASPLSVSYNTEDDGYVDIVAADCGCSYKCAVYEDDDQFECLCPNGTTPAPDPSDCYYSECISFSSVYTSLAKH